MKKFILENQYTPKLNTNGGHDMCESNLYSVDGDLLMEDVILIEVLEDGIKATDVLNSTKKFEGKLTRLDLDKHRIYIKQKK